MAFTATLHHEEKVDLHQANIVSSVQNGATQLPQFDCIGRWTVSHLGPLSSHYTEFISDLFKAHSCSEQPNPEIQISAQSLQALDSAGALLLFQMITWFKTTHNCNTKLVDFSAAQLELIELIETKQAIIQEESKTQGIKRHEEDLLEFIGHETIQKVHQFDGLIRLVGDLTDKIFRGFGQWKKFQIPSVISIINSAGLKALPIIGLLSFLIGVVLAYQMGLQLETYGANLYIAYLSGMAIFREFGPLITAIIVAGRTSSSFTAQIGSMKLNEEIDALKTMGLSPIELLALPKVLGLMLIFPLIIFWSNVFSIIGAMIMSKFMLHVGYLEFLNRLKIDVGADQMMLGLYKAPTFALLIALVGCFQGFQVEHNADSIGSQTTRSVVQALFLIIIADAIYSVIYSWMDL